jgi:DNA-binding transcriptional LysR family regulator
MDHLENAMLDWDDVRYFLAVARSGGLNSAARQLGTTASRVSRHVESLERQFLVPLFVRGREGMLLADEGKRLLPKAEAMEAAAFVLAGAANATGRIEGRVRLATADTIAIHLVAPALPDFLQKHPHLDLEIITGLRTVDLDRLEADISLRLVRPSRGNIIRSKLGDMARALYCRRAGSADTVIGWPDDISDLAITRWSRSRFGASRITAGTLSLHHAIARSGAGQALLPCFIGDADPELIRNGPILPEAKQEIWLAINAELKSSARVGAVAGFLGAVVAANAKRLTGQFVLTDDKSLT